MWNFKLWEKKKVELVWLKQGRFQNISHLNLTPCPHHETKNTGAEPWGSRKHSLRTTGRVRAPFSGRDESHLLQIHLLCDKGSESGGMVKAAFIPAGGSSPSCLGGCTRSSRMFYPPRLIPGTLSPPLSSHTQLTWFLKWVLSSLPLAGAAPASPVSLPDLLPSSQALA